MTNERKFDRIEAWGENPVSLVVLGEKMVNGNRKGMPTRKALKRHWLKTSMAIIKGYSKELLAQNNNMCFACGNIYDYNLERCHIVPLRNGGTNHYNNIHLLCDKCHAESEYLDDIDGVEYYNWFFGLDYKISPKKTVAYNPNGNPENLTNEHRLLGAITNKNNAIERDSQYIQKVIELRNIGYSYNKIAKILSDNNKSWYAIQIKRMVDRKNFQGEQDDFDRSNTK